ncbi:hypothetical protein EH223_08685 [candidate division KSB1 bacterium]|nr:Rieske 2Fe-2S domain-containing protein [candidate division KSB1 bacterium]RQW03900.1 MAG: hypothetical protein EH223_08685 [candidate division KSB1 bacterium]
MIRREMLRQTALTTGCLCTCGVLKVLAQESDCCNTPDLEPESYTIQKDRIVVDIQKAPCLAEPGHAAFISAPDKDIDIILVRPDAETFVALSRFCTHGRQVLSYNPDRRLLQCNSYNHSLFELDGQVFKGPAEKPLISYVVIKNQHQLTIWRRDA